MRTPADRKDKKKRTTSRILKELYKDAQESCDRLLQELDRSIPQTQELFVREEKNT